MFLPPKSWTMPNHANSDNHAEQNNLYFGDKKFLPPCKGLNLGGSPQIFNLARGPSIQLLWTISRGDPKFLCAAIWNSHRLSSNPSPKDMDEIRMFQKALFQNSKTPQSSSLFTARRRHFRNLISSRGKFIYFKNLPPKMTDGFQMKQSLGLNDTFPPIAEENQCSLHDALATAPMLEDFHAEKLENARQHFVGWLSVIAKLEIWLYRWQNTNICKLLRTSKKMYKIPCVLQKNEWKKNVRLFFSQKRKLLQAASSTQDGSEHNKTDIDQRVVFKSLIVRIQFVVWAPSGYGRAAILWFKDLLNPPSMWPLAIWAKQGSQRAGWLDVPDPPLPTEGLKRPFGPNAVHRSMQKQETRGWTSHHSCPGTASGFGSTRGWRRNEHRLCLMLKQTRSCAHLSRLLSTKHDNRAAVSGFPSGVSSFVEQLHTNTLRREKLALSLPRGQVRARHLWDASSFGFWLCLFRGWVFSKFSPKK